MSDLKQRLDEWIAAGEAPSSLLIELRDALEAAEARAGREVREADEYWMAKLAAAEARAEKAEGLVEDWVNEHGGSGPTISLLERSRALVWSQNPDSEKQ